MCTSESKFIQFLHVRNVTTLVIPPLLHGLMHTPPEVIFEDIGEIETIHPKTFIQLKKFQFSRFGCYNPMKHLESVVFKNVKVGTISKDAFYNLTEFKNFTFENVTVLNKIEHTAVHLIMDKNIATVTHSKIGIMEFLSFNVRGDTFSFSSNTVDQIHTSAIKAAVYNFNFINNSISWIHFGGLSVLAKNVKISDSVFDYLSSGAFQTIGPGLPENALLGFGDLNFFYEFKNNLVESLEVASLHPDWKAYKKVGGILAISYNALKCTCIELAWLGSKEGFGKEFSALDEFHGKFLDKDNNNICIDSPCTLPVDAVRHMLIKDGRCLHNYSQEALCSLYFPTTVRTTTFRANVKHTTPYLQFLKIAKLPLARSDSILLRPNYFIMFLVVMFYNYVC